MRSKTDLLTIAAEHGVQTDETMTSRQIMDAMRDALGTTDPSMQVDPMKAKDLKSKIDWAAKDAERFAGIQQLTDDKHVAEPKLDGVRVRLFMGESANSLNSGLRSKVSYGYTERADNFPHLRDAVIPELAGTILDAELLMPGPVFLGDKKGWTVGPLNSIMAVFNINSDDAIDRQREYGKAVLYVFDVLAIAGLNVMEQPYHWRRAEMEKIVKRINDEHQSNLKYVEDGNVRFVLPVMSSPATPEVVDGFLRRGFEGAMIKHVDGTYKPGKRGNEWLKIKKMSTGDFYIIGSNPGTGRNEGKVGSLKVAYKDDITNNPVYVADVRGFDDATCTELTDPDTGDVKEEYIGRVIEVMAQGRTKNERLRHPHFVRWRPDKRRMDCGRDQFELFDEV